MRIASEYIDSCNDALSRQMSERSDPTAAQLCQALRDCSSARPSFILHAHRDSLTALTAARKRRDMDNTFDNAARDQCCLLWPARQCVRCEVYPDLESCPCSRYRWCNVSCERLKTSASKWHRESRYRCSLSPVQHSRAQHSITPDPNMQHPEYT